MTSTRLSTTLKRGHTLVAVLLLASCGGSGTDGGGGGTTGPTGPTVTSVTVSPDSARLVALGATVPLSAVVAGRTPPAATWASRDPAVATVDAAGLVTAISNGTTYVVASASTFSDSARIVVEQVATQLAFVAAPTSAEAGERISPAVRVSIQDARGNPMPNAASVTVTIALASSSSDAVLSGGTFGATTGGSISYSTLTLDRPGSNFILAASAPGLASATSAQFSVYIIFTSVSAGDFTTCAVSTRQRVYCWGLNNFGQAGVPYITTPYIYKPVPVVGGVAFRSVSVGLNHACGVTTAGRLMCWGGNTYGMKGDGTRTTSNVPGPVDYNLTWLSVSAGRWHTCGITTGNLTYCWGRNQYGQLGDGTTGLYNLLPQLVAAPVGGGVFSSVSVGADVTCGVVAVRRAADCWGLNDHGQLGNGTRTNSARPVAVTGFAAKVASVSTGATHACLALDDTGLNRVYCWGSGGSGEIGDALPIAADRLIPTAVAFNGISYDVSAGGRFSCSITNGGIGVDPFGMSSATSAANGSVYCWGANADGQLGNNTVIGRAAPTALVGSISVSQISVGGTHACALSPIGRVFCWGKNQYGQIGIGPITAGESIPRQVGLS